MDGQNMGYTADNGGGYDQSYDTNDTNAAGSENYQLEDQTQYDSGYAQPPMPGPHSTTAGSLFRSEEMALCQLFLQSEAAYACVSELGELGSVQFRDLNPDTNAFQRKFVNEVRRCDEMERKLRFLEKEIKKDDIPMLDADQHIEAPTAEQLEIIEEQLKKKEVEIQDVNQNSETLQSRTLELLEMLDVLKTTRNFFEDHDMLSINSKDRSNNIRNRNRLDEEAQEVMGLTLSFVAGVIKTEKMLMFEKIITRICYENAFLRNLGNLKELQGKTSCAKSVFIIFFQGSKFKDKIKKMATAFDVILYPCQQNTEERKEMEEQAEQSLEEIYNVLKITTQRRDLVLNEMAQKLKIWHIQIKKAKAIYHYLNMFRLSAKQECLIAECWIPVLDIASVKASLDRGTEKFGSIVPSIIHQIDTTIVPPTYFRTNKYTSAFQCLINSYGVASYGETNPAAYTIVTFPFLFAVMFGDSGHGCLMLAFGLYLCLNEKKLESKKTDNEIWQIFFAGRYLITLMALFSIFTGLIYNDIFSKSINIFGSSFQAYQENESIMGSKSAMINPASGNGYYGTPYIFGIDPVWQVSENKIVFLNAFKMKISIILGVLHMLFGVFLSLGNHKYFGESISIWAEFVPQVIFLLGMFGYLAFLMIIKWWIYYATNVEANLPNSQGCAPSVLITFINMVLFKSEPALQGCETVYMMGPFQKYLQNFLVIVSLLCVPVMLLVKPILKKREMQNQPQSNILQEADQKHREKFDFSEIMILQAIHTIEYVLGSVSHTASYLRLWALSLAHAQLSEVLWNMVMRIGFHDAWWGGLVLWAIFAAWAALTVSILVLMEGLSAFLHTLRLHWVEFQSKFYKGDGYLFVPFSFDEILKQAEAEPSG